MPVYDSKMVGGGVAEESATPAGSLRATKQGTVSAPACGVPDSASFDKLTDFVRMPEILGLQACRFV